MKKHVLGFLKIYVAVLGAGILFVIIGCLICLATGIEIVPRSCHAALMTANVVGLFLASGITTVNIGVENEEKSRR